jgi:hypothetical protein
MQVELMGPWRRTEREVQVKTKGRQGLGLSIASESTWGKQTPEKVPRRSQLLRRTRHQHVYRFSQGGGAHPCALEGN